MKIPHSFLLRRGMLALAACMSLVGSGVSNASPEIRSGNFVVTAPTSPNNALCLQNVMEYIDKHWRLGYITTDFSTNSAAVTRPHVLRGCQITFGPTNYAMWDGTNGPTGPFANENGSRLGWGFDISDTNLFQASAWNFKIWSTDNANTLQYSGNLATNTGTLAPLVFSSLFRGQVLDGTNVIADYHNGESITTPVNRVFGVLRIGYYCAGTNELALSLNYFKGVMQMTNYFALTSSGASATNQLSTLVYINIPQIEQGSAAHINIEGQRQLGLYYSLYRRLALDRSGSWVRIKTDLPEGMFHDMEWSSQAYYKAWENSVPFPIAPTFSGLSASAPAPSPVIAGSNGQE